MAKIRILLILIISLIKLILTENWEDDVHIICPNQCVCQYSNFMDLSIARWANLDRIKFYNKFINNYYNKNEDVINNNEAKYSSSSDDIGDDDNFSYTIKNPVIKLAMCMIQAGSEPKDLLNILPQDVQALIILYSGNGINVSVSTSDFDILSDLRTLEIRGSNDHSLHLIIDKPLRNLENVNFESIQLIGSEKLKRPKNPKHPSESFDYVPKSERFNYNTTKLNEFKNNNIHIETDNGSIDDNNDEIEILPYDLYIMEMHKSRIPSFYDWTNLLILRIHNCKLYELDWEMFNGLENLQLLSLEHNEIKIIPSFAFYGALHIKILSLAHNYILDLNYRSLAGLLDLEILDLSSNNLTKLSELTFPPFPKLNQIDFRSNPIQYIFPATFGIMNNTKIMLFDSNRNQLDLTTEKQFEYLELLKFLSIKNCTIEILEQNTLKGLRNLEILNLKGNIHKIEYDTFSEMENLQILDLSKLNLNEISMDAFIGCRNLLIINLSFNNLEYLPPGLFDEQNSLKEIYLNDNKLRYLSMDFFQLEQLKLARLINNPWKCTCDMIIWKPSITNQYRGLRKEHCIRDFYTGKKISCKILDIYKFDNKLSPRCSNIKGHSIYYALRKDLQCDFKKELEQYKNVQKLNRNKLNKKKLMKLNLNKKNSVIQTKEDDFNARKKLEGYEMKRSKKIHKIPRKVNTLKHLSSSNNNENYDSGNNPLGKIDDLDSFNFI